MNHTPYNQTDHTHCWESKNPPCGQKIEHLKCCLCELFNPKVLKETKEAYWEGIKVMSEEADRAIDRAREEARNPNFYKDAVEIGREQGHTTERERILYLVEKQRIKLAKRVGATHFSFVFDDIADAIKSDNQQGK